MVTRIITLCAALIVVVAGYAFAQDTAREALEELEWGDAASLEQTDSLRKRAAKLTIDEAATLYEQLTRVPADLRTRMILMFYEEPENQKKRRAKRDPVPHGELVLGLVEQHPRSNIAGTAGLLLYAHMREGLYTGPAWEQAIELWERLADEHPKDAAIACNAGCFLIAHPFRMGTDGPRALVMFERARKLAPGEPRYALKFGEYYSMLRSMTREPEERSIAAKAAIVHLRAAWDLTAEDKRGALDVRGEPLSMPLAEAYFDAGDHGSARTFAKLALDGLNPEKPSGRVVYDMNALLGRIAFAADDLDSARRYLLAASRTTGSASLSSFGPDLALAKELMAAGKGETVREFLVNCRRFWTSGKDRLDAWIELIDQGRDPWDGDGD